MGNRARTRPPDRMEATTHRQLEPDGYGAALSHVYGEGTTESARTRKSPKNEGAPPSTSVHGNRLGTPRPQTENGAPPSTSVHGNRLGTHRSNGGPILRSRKRTSAMGPKAIEPIPQADIGDEPREAIQPIPQADIGDEPRGGKSACAIHPL